MIIDIHNKNLYKMAAAKRVEADAIVDDDYDHEWYTVEIMKDREDELREEADDLEAAANYMVGIWHDREALVKVIAKMGSLANNVDLR